MIINIKELVFIKLEKKNVKLISLILTQDDSTDVLSYKGGMKKGNIQWFFLSTQQPVQSTGICLVFVIYI